MSSSKVYFRTTQSIVLGAVFFFQAATSLISGAMLLNPLIVEGDVGATMMQLAEHPVRVQASVLLDILTAIGIILLGVLLYSYLKKVHRVISLFALCLYVFEAALLVVSKFFTYALFSVSQIYVEKGTTSLIELGTMLIKTKDFAYSSHIIPFGIGAFLFYLLLLKSNYVPKWLALWGVITVPIILIGVTLMMYGVNVPFVILLPYVPFEFVAGGFILIKGLKTQVN